MWASFVGETAGDIAYKLDMHRKVVVASSFIMYVQVFEDLLGGFVGVE
jgi:hypothetical protein